VAHDRHPRNDRDSPHAAAGNPSNVAHDRNPRNDRDSPHAAAGNPSNVAHDLNPRNDRDSPHAAAENPSGVTHEPVPEAARRSPHEECGNQSSGVHDPSSADDRRTPHEARGNQSNAAHDPNPRNDPDNPHAAVGSQSHSTGGQSPAAYRGSPHGATTRKVHLYPDRRAALTCAELHRGFHAQNSSLARTRPGEGEVSRRTSCCCARPSFPTSNGPSWADRPWPLVGTTWAPERSPRRVPFGRHPLPSALTSPAPGRTAARPIPTPQLLRAHRWTHRRCSPRLVPKSRTAVRRRFFRSPRRLGVLCLRRLGHRSPGRYLPDPSHPIGAHHLKIRHALPNPDDRPRLGGRLCVRCRPVCSRRHPALTDP